MSKISRKHTGETLFSIQYKTKGTFNDVPFEAMKNKILGLRYDLSLVFIGEHLSRKLNRTYREKDKSTNILSFPLSKNSGEIFITPKKAFRQAHKFNKTEPDFIAYLFIHGLLHLKGLEHGSKMIAEEKKYERYFKIQ